MPTLRITITAPLPEDPLELFRDKHELEGVVLQIIDALDDPARVAVTSEVDPVDMPLGGLAVVRRRPGRPAKAKPAANGEAVGQTAPEAA